MMIVVSQPRTPQKPFDRVDTELRARIAAGEWAPGEQLPAVTVLATQLATSKATVSRVTRALADEGLVTIVTGWGTFLADQQPDDTGHAKGPGCTPGPA
jgi:GntR family histidine utilization transcriptional repressor